MIVQFCKDWGAFKRLNKGNFTPQIARMLIDQGAAVPNGMPLPDEPAKEKEPELYKPKVVLPEPEPKKPEPKPEAKQEHEQEKPAPKPKPVKRQVKRKTKPRGKKAVK